ncbi:glycosyltransferase [Helicobacter sp. MIT 05-5294]|uniref:glycosyltransferase n=1 Tax=Helicobacter sp. MIT 05-5294 TaxID=1548150 RepID=UPI00051FBE49|nr:glycosyltransferase [Helicobacter sp. MIT 05-5294]TLD87542.1 glycosyl transferase [Helicobacter sp. MIT 05-5294]
MKKHSFGILLCATCDSAFVIGSLMANIKQKCGEKVDIFYLIHDGFKTSDKEALRKIAGESIVRFETFTKEDFLAKLNAFAKKPIKLNNHRFLGRWTHMVYACFEGFRFLDECKCIVYLDFDILLLQEIVHLKKLRQQGFVLGARRGKTSLANSCLAYQGRFQNTSVFQTPIIVYNDTLENPKECYDFIYQVSAQNPLNINDQGTFSLLVFEKNLKIKDLGNRYVGSVLWRKNHNPILIHAYGPKNRFWNNRLCNQIWNEWNAYYQAWLESGGSPNTKGFVANTTYGYERIRYHLAYKLGYCIIANYQSLLGCLKLPFLLALIALRHKKEARFYQKIIKLHPHLKLPPLESYEDYQSALLEKQTFSYCLGEALIEACKTFYKGGILKFFATAKNLRKEAYDRMLSRH